MKRPVKKLHYPIRDDIGDLRTVRPLPNPQLPHLDPFLFLNHHGHQIYPPNNSGLPFAPHPHRGFETVTFVLKGELTHRDSAGHESIINEGGIQWMTAGRGIVHEEVSSEEFKKTGGELEILQLWVNLPKSLKMTEPRYIGYQRDEIPSFEQNQVRVNLVAGHWEDKKGALHSLTGINIMTIEMQENGSLKLRVPAHETVFLYLVFGHISVNDTEVKGPHLIEMENQGEEIQLQCHQLSTILFGHAPPLNEPIVSYGPFVMNTREEIMEAINDFEGGRF